MNIYGPAIRKLKVKQPHRLVNSGTGPSYVTKLLSQRLAEEVVAVGATIDVRSSYSQWRPSVARI